MTTPTIPPNAFSRLIAHVFLLPKFPDGCDEKSPDKALERHIPTILLFSLDKFEAVVSKDDKAAVKRAKNSICNFLQARKDDRSVKKDELASMLDSSDDCSYHTGETWIDVFELTVHQILFPCTLTSRMLVSSFVAATAMLLSKLPNCSQK